MTAQKKKSKNNQSRLLHTTKKIYKSKWSPEKFSLEPFKKEKENDAHPYRLLDSPPISTPPVIYLCTRASQKCTETSQPAPRPPRLCHSSPHKVSPCFPPAAAARLRKRMSQSCAQMRSPKTPLRTTKQHPLSNPLTQHTPPSSALTTTQIQTLTHAHSLSLPIASH
jgi:hypothetical protein